MLEGLASGATADKRVIDSRYRISQRDVQTARIRVRDQMAEIADPSDLWKTGSEEQFAEMEASVDKARVESE